MTRLSPLLFALAAALLLGVPAAATTYTYNCVACGGNSDAGELLSLTTTYDDDTQLLTWSSTFGVSPTTGSLPSTAWLVLTDGPNPNGNPGQFSIFYLDGVHLGIATAYQYDTANGPNSWQNPAGLLETFFFVVGLADNPDGTRTMNFMLHATHLNSLGGNVGFGENIGLWFYPAAGGLAFNYPQAGGINGYDFNFEGSYEIANQPTVPEPSLGLMMALGLAGLFGAGSRRS